MIATAEKKRRFRATQRYNGKKYEATGKTQREADRKLAEKIATIKRGEQTVGGTMTVDSWHEMWLTTYKIPTGVSEAAIDDYRSRYRVHIGPAIGHMKMQDVKDIHLQRILNECAGMSQSLVNKLMGQLQAMFLRARKSRIIPVDPAEDLVRPDCTVGVRRALTDLERAKLLETAKTHKYGLWVLTQLYTGMRPGESVALTWANVDFDRNEIHVVQARKNGTRETKEPKTASGIRDIPLIPELKALLQAEKDRIQPEPFALVFPSRTGRVLSSEGLKGRWRIFRKAAGLPDELTAYNLRHTFATDLQRMGVPINVAKELMGHSDIAMTARVYTHRDRDTLHRNMEQYADGIRAAGG